MWLKFDFSMLGGLCIKLVGELAPACTPHTKHSKPLDSLLDNQNETQTHFGYVYIYIIILGMGSGVHYMYIFKQ